MSQITPNVCHVGALLSRGVQTGNADLQPSSCAQSKEPSREGRKSRFIYSKVKHSCVELLQCCSSSVRLAACSSCRGLWSSRVT